MVHVECSETHDSHVFKVVLPGLKAEDVKVAVDDGVLTVTVPKPASVSQVMSSPTKPVNIKKAAETRNRSNQKASTVGNDDIDPNGSQQYYLNGKKFVEDIKASGGNPYPHSFKVSSSVEDYIKKYATLKKGERLEDVQVSLAGKIIAIRHPSPKLYFYDLHGDGYKVQVIANARDSNLSEDGFSALHSGVRRGDLVGIRGYPGRSDSGVCGELSIFPRDQFTDGEECPASFIVLARCFHMLEMQKAFIKNRDGKLSNWVPGMPRNPANYALNKQDIRHRERYLDLIANPEVRQVFDTRSDVIRYIRDYLHNRKFREVETPILNPTVGGASAKPFVTHLNDLHMNVNLRISPELYLKRLIVGGYERVFEIGKQFRNEALDTTHNPEFTTCEFYMAYEDYYSLMTLTEEMLSGMVKKLTGGYKIKYHANGSPVEIDFTPPFRRIDMIEELEKLANINIPQDLSSEEANKYLADACERFNVICPPPQTTARLLDKLVGHFLEETCTDPTFIMNHPEIMSPLAKSHRSRPGLTERFELFISKFEVCNAYTELNDPVEQRRRFEQQMKDRQSGDDEAMPIDEDYIKALECGLTPTGGWGLGIDRLVMLLTDSQHIKEVILFPTMKPQM